ncbi:MAG TPA: tetratricopeptide repeat protein [Aquabacterium sp.]|nr:tetratricopeptide repeat protein [Aquabacterium sp.]
MSKQIEQLKKQLRQLTELARDGALSDVAFQEAKAKLERELLDAVMLGSKPEPLAPTVSRNLILGMAAFVAAAGVAGYAWLGHPDAWQVGPGKAPDPMAVADGNPSARAPHALGMEQIEAMTDSLAAKLKANPHNPDGWAMLGRSYAVLGKWDQAIAAYQQVMAQRPDDAQVYADYADALAVKQGRTLAGEPAKLVAKALSLDPANFKALSLSGTIAFDKQDFKSAADLWERALKNAPSDNPELARQIKASLDDARQRAGLPTAGESLASAPTEVSGRVTLSKDLAGKVSPEDTVFIFARVAQGSKMPLAIVRKQVKDLPFAFTLNDALAMSPQARLSKETEVVVGARVSKSGQAMPQEGDWQGLTPVVKVGARDLEVVIKDPIQTKP